MANPTGKSYVGRFGVHLAVLFFVALWTLPTLGILVSSLRDKDQIIVSGWWTAMTSSTQTEAGRLPPPNTAVERDGKFVLEGNLFKQSGSREITNFGIRAQAPTEFEAGSVADLGDG
jgi:alpha-glucoside transport system permease protein